MRPLEFHDNPIWLPKENSTGRMSRFIKLIEMKYNITFQDYWQFRQWTAENLSEFWGELWDFLDIIYSKRFSQVIDMSIPIDECPKWFEGARLNFAENMLRHRDEKVALIVTGEYKDTELVTYKQLYEETCLYSAALRKFGIKRGEVVSCFMSNRKEAIIAMLAVTSIGAIWVGTIVGLGSKGFLSQMKALKPRILFTVDKYASNGDVLDLLPDIKCIEEGLNNLEKIIICTMSWHKRRDISKMKKCCFLENFLAMGYNADGSVSEMQFEQMSVSDPIFIVHTSGTTGSPKAIVHGSGPGWSVWNGFSMLLFFGATLVVYEGSPYFLSSTYLWDLIDRLKITTLTLTTRILDELEGRGYMPNKMHDLGSLKTVLAYASVVMPQTFDLVLTKLKRDITFLIMYACTDIISSFAVTELTVPLYRGEISSVSLGVASDIVDEEGNSVTGKEGEFILKKSVPSFPLCFWGDKNRKNLRKEYFAKYPGKFTMGDAALINPITNGLNIFGRSEETIKVKELYFRSYDIYAALEGLYPMKDAICVAQYSKKDTGQRAVLFVKVQDDFKLSEERRQEIRTIIHHKLSDTHVPKKIIGVPDIPYNINGKKMESLVRRIINHLPHSTEMVSNLDCLKYFYNNLKLEEY